MKRNTLLLTLALAVTGGMTLFAQQKSNAPVFKTESAITIDKKTFKPGDKIPVKIVCTCPAETHQVGSWRVVAYLRDIPEGFEKLPKFKVFHQKDPKWSWVETDQGYWFKPQQRKNRKFNVTIDTTGWPEGDYRININNCFQPIVKGEKFIYRAGSISCTIEK